MTTSAALRANHKQFPLPSVGTRAQLDRHVSTPTGSSTSSTSRLLKATEKRELFIRRRGLYSNVVRTARPLHVTRARIEEGIVLLADSLAAFAETAK